MKPKSKDTIARQLLKGSLLASLGLSSVAFQIAVLADDVALADDVGLTATPEDSSGAGAKVRINEDIVPRTPLSQALANGSPELEAFYVLQQGELFWQDEPRVATLVNLLGALEADGLVPADYQPEQLRADARLALARDASEAQRVRFDLQASETLLTALGHLQRGRLSPRQVYHDWEIAVEPPSLDLADIQTRIAQGQVEQVLALARPGSPDYHALRQALERYRSIAAQGGWPRLPERDMALRLGDEHEDVILLRQRLAAEGETGLLPVDVNHYPGVAIDIDPSRRYDAELLGAIRHFQRRHMLSDDGVVGPQTRRALNVPVEQRLRSLRANLERARWMGEPLQGQFLEVDLAGQLLRYQRDSGDIWETRVIVGSSARQSPVLKSAITHLTLNPTWTLPPTILREDVLPRVRRNPGYLSSRGYDVLSASGERLDPRSINWSHPGNVMIRQPAGGNNPLGRMVLRFPNNHLVYLHDTPARGLFGRPQRALSSGCIRVEGVDELAQMLFDDTGTSINLSSRLASGRTRNVNLSKEVPLVMHYWTARVREGGLPSFRPDIYGRDPALVEALLRAPQLVSGL